MNKRTTSDGAVPVSSASPSGFAAPLLNAARVDLTLTRGPRPLPAQVCASRVGSRLLRSWVLRFVPEAIEPSARAGCHTRPPEGPARFRRQEAGQRLCRRVGEYGSRNPGNHEAEHPSRRAEFVRQSLGEMPPTDCEWPEVPATAYSENVSTSATADIRRIQALFKTSFDEIHDDDPTQRPGRAGGGDFDALHG